MVLAIGILGVAGILASGVLLRHARMLTLIATAGVLWEMMWLLLTLIDRTVFEGLASEKVYLFGAVLLLVAWVPLYGRWRLPYMNGEGSGRRDMVVMLVILITVLGAGMVLGANGYEDGELIWHGYFNGDTTTWVALIQGSLLTDGLVDINVFAADADLEYPTLLHGGIAGLIGGLGMGMNWLRLLPIMTYLQIFLTVPMFFLLMDSMMPEPIDKWRNWLGVNSRWGMSLVQGGIVAYVMAVSIDNYIYPQSHFFLTAGFMLLVGLLYKQYRARGEEELMYLLPAMGIALVLLLSNAVTGTAAVVLIAINHALIAMDRSRMPWKRGAHLLGGLMWLGLFLSMTPGNSALGGPGFSYVAAGNMMWVAPMLIWLMVAVLMQLEVKRDVAAGVVGLSLLTFIVFIFSGRPIVVDNAERFIYHGLLVGTPLLMLPLVRGYFLIRRYLVLSTKKLPELLTGWAAVLLMVVVLGVPAISSLIRAGDNLLKQNELVIDTGQLEASWWINENTSEMTTILASPEEPWVVPLLTGRALVRSDFWLSPQDETLQDMVNAFEGDVMAQKRTLQLADYLLLTSEQRKLWEPLVYEKVFDINSIVIYSLAGS